MLYQLSYLPDVYAVYIEFRQKQGNWPQRRKIETRAVIRPDSPAQPEQSAAVRIHTPKSLCSRSTGSSFRLRISDFHNHDLNHV
ncbi:MAG: hypothetical protein ACK5MS_09305, partial [Planctomyces sp.]